LVFSTLHTAVVEACLVGMLQSIGNRILRVSFREQNFDWNNHPAVQFQGTCYGCTRDAWMRRYASIYWLVSPRGAHAQHADRRCQWLRQLDDLKLLSQGIWIIESGLQRVNFLHGANQSCQSRS
jgi:hypothetical protein